MDENDARDHRLPWLQVLRARLPRSASARLRRLMSAARPQADSPATPTVLLVYRRLLGRPNSSIRLLAVARSEDEIRRIIAPLGLSVESREVEWEEVPLGGRYETSAQGPHMERVHVVSDGGIGNDGVEYNQAPIGLGAFADLPSAEAFAAATATQTLDPCIHIRSVPVGVALS